MVIRCTNRLQFSSILNQFYDTCFPSYCPCCCINFVTFGTVNEKRISKNIHSFLQLQEEEPKSIRQRKANHKACQKLSGVNPPFVMSGTVQFHNNITGNATIRQTKQATKTTAKNAVSISPAFIFFLNINHLRPSFNERRISYLYFCIIVAGCFLKSTVI